MHITFEKVSRAVCKVYSKDNDDYDHLFTAETSDIGTIPSSWSQTSTEKTVLLNLNDINFAVVRKNVWKAYSNSSSYVHDTTLKMDCAAKAGIRLLSVLPIGMSIPLMPILEFPLKGIAPATEHPESASNHDNNEAATNADPVEPTKSQSAKTFTEEDFLNLQEIASNIKYNQNTVSYPIDYSLRRISVLPESIKSFAVQVPGVCYDIGEGSSLPEAAWRVCMQPFETDLASDIPKVTSEITVDCNSETRVGEPCNQLDPALTLYNAIQTNQRSITFTARSAHNQEPEKSSFLEYIAGDEIAFLSYSHTKNDFLGKQSTLSSLAPQSFLGDLIGSGNDCFDLSSEVIGYSSLHFCKKGNGFEFATTFLNMIDVSVFPPFHCLAVF
jgi:hypothetical protein